MKKKLTLTKQSLISSVVIHALLFSNFAHAANPEFKLDVTFVIAAIAVVVAAVTSVASSALTITLVVKAFGYVKRAV